MDRESFASAFQMATKAAIESAEKSLGRRLDQEPIVRLYGAGANGADISPTEFVDRSYISENSFYRLIDLMVVEVIDSKPILFARISDHPPAPLKDTWNGMQGPFKQLKADTISQK